MTPIPFNRKFSPVRSLRVRILLAISASVLLMVAAVIGFGAHQIQHMSVVQVQHEGILLSHVLESALQEPAARGDVAAMQAYIDRLVRQRDKNDMEVNVVMLRGAASDIVASNVPDNIEEADEEEHAATLAALQSGKPDLEIEVEDQISTAPVDQQAPPDHYHGDPSHPDYYFPAGSRLLSITTPLKAGERALGSINVKLSLHYLDTELAMLTRWSLLAMGAGCLILAGVLTPFLSRNVFDPLQRLAREMYVFGMGNDIGELIPTVRQDEIGVLTNEFYSMAARVKSAEAMREELAREKAAKKERELQEKLRQAQKMEALGTLAGGIAHDFNNMLTPIMGYTELLMMKMPEDSELRADLDEVTRASARARDLVRQILTFSRQTDEAPCAFEIGAIVKETLKFLRATLPANIEMCQTINCNGSMVTGRPTHVHQVVLNLATNACQAMADQGGRLDVGLVHETVADETMIGDGFTLAPGRYVKLTVADTGPGIGSDVMDRIFEPYFTTKQDRDGTGLGLAMVHGIVKDMGGGIAAVSEVGHGTRFEAYFALAADHADDIAPQPAAILSGGTESIMIVDDEQSITDMIGRMLTPLGYRTDIYTSSSAALERLQSHPGAYDLIITDVAMPGMTGIEFVRKLSTAPQAPPVILCSAYTGGINWRRADAIGIKAVLLKPLRREQLATAVRDVLDGKAAPLGSEASPVRDPQLVNV
ncbi:MAG: response regulator [Verrucomicrobia bacterium]|nr:response regulator [Verrucomicrobiota bacterium]